MFTEKAEEIKTDEPKLPATVPQETREESHEEATMTVVEHLEELRFRIIRSFFYLVAGFIASCFVTKEAIQLLEVPAKGISFTVLSFEEPMMVFFKVAFYLALVIASPFILLELSLFISPGLTRKEKQVLAPIVIGGPVLFVCGALFAYYCVLPPMLHFFSTFGQGLAPINQRLDYYISLTSSILLYMGLCFQLPIILFALSFTGFVNSNMLFKVWRYATFGAALVAAIITPDPTAVSMLIVMGALLGLYFLSIILLKVFGR